MDTLQAEVLAHSKDLALSWLFASGGTVIPPTRDAGHMVHVPFSLLPRPMPKQLYMQAVALAKPFNELVDAVARDTGWLISTLRRTGASDPFTGRLLELLELVARNSAGPRCDWMLGLHRSDYMIDHGRDGRRAPSLKQIELNTISSSFGALSCTVGRLHSFLADPQAGALARDHVTAAAISNLYGGKGGVAPVPSDGDASALASGLAAAVDVYLEDRGLTPVSTAARGGLEPGKVTHASVPATEYGPVVVLYVVQPNERNVMDQRKLEFAFRAATGNAITVRRVTLADVARRCTVASGTNRLLYQSQQGGQAEEVALVYFRAGYTPADHPTEAEWSARAIIETSVAVKCPSVAYHLAGTKKVQQALAAPGVLERFVKDPSTAAQLRSCFAGLWSVDPSEADAETSAAIDRARQDPAGFVMKPQREGGGNNIYGPDIATALSGPGSGGFSAEDLAGFILMERVFPEASPAIFVRAGAHAVAPALSELGIFGVYLGNGKEVRVNYPAGHLLRTKVANSDEGGVAAGFAVLDTPYLTE